MTGTRGGRGSRGTRTGATPLAPDLVVLGRYRLVDRVADNGGTSLWRGVDDRLRRPVAVRFMAIDDALADDLRLSAARASHVTDRRAVAVLDIDSDLVTEKLVIVTEWLAGTTLGDLIASRGGEPMPARQSALIALEVARFLAAADEEGVPHGRIRPNCVIVTDTGEVRVRGLGVDSALYGVDPGDDPIAADVHGGGAVLYACLTGRWPGGEEVDGLAPVPSVDRGRVPWPSRVVVDVPRELDDVVARSLLTTQQPKGRGRYATPAEAVAGINAYLNPQLAPITARGQEPWRPWLRAGTVLFFAASAVALGALGISLLTGLGSPPVNAPRAAGQTGPASASPTPTVSGTPVPEGTRVIPVVSVKDFDPYGDTKQENPQLAPLAIDGKPPTAWTTVRYRQADLSGKPGVGLLLDLGAPRPVRAVELRLVGNGTDLSLRATDDPSKAPEDFRSLAEVTGASNTLTLRVPKPVTTRYLLIWLTTVPSNNGTYQGGVAEARVLG